MKKTSLITIFTILCGLNLVGQTSHLSLVYDFVGDDFDHSVRAMVGTNDSLYIIKNTQNGQGEFFRIDQHGEGYQTIWIFDDVNYAPNSLVGNDTIIYGTTRFSSNGGGTIFKYSLEDYTFEFIKDFDNLTEVQETRIKYITDSVLWFTSQQSAMDEGSIFTISPDGSQLEKIYNQTNIDNGQNPVDFVFYNDSIYIAFYNGGGIPYPDGTGSFSSSGSFVRIKSDGAGYEKIITGGDHVGTQPQSLLIRENKIIGLFANSGSNSKLGAQFFRSNLDGTSYDSLGGLNYRSLTALLSTDSLIYGASSSSIFGVNPFSGEIRIFDDILENPDFGWDIVTTPAVLNGTVYLSAQQKGPGNSGGTILKWSNEKPIFNALSETSRISQDPKTINLNELFTDPEGDSLTFEVEYNPELLSIDISEGILTITTESDEAEIKITANDGWTGYTSVTLNLDFAEEDPILNIKENHNYEVLYPNPASSFLKLDKDINGPIQFLGLDGSLLKTIPDSQRQIDISFLNKGIYLIRYSYKGKIDTKRIIKL